MACQHSSNLHLEIMDLVVRYPEDAGSYQCILIAVTASGEIKRYQSQSVVLNIKGKIVPWIMLLRFFIVMCLFFFRIITHFKI